MFHFCQGLLNNVVNTPKEFVVTNFYKLDKPPCIYFFKPTVTKLLRAIFTDSLGEDLPIELNLKERSDLYVRNFISYRIITIRIL